MSDDQLLSLELRISVLLRWGVLLAGAFMLIGWASMLDFTQNPLAAFHDYKSESLKDSLHSAVSHQQWGLLIAYAGLALLISLPLLRVLMTAILFIKQKEKVLAAIAFFVFATLILSFSLGIEL
jgi:uncharacterized membrane protein